MALLWVDRRHMKDLPWYNSALSPHQRSTILFKTEKATVLMLLQAHLQEAVAVKATAAVINNMQWLLEPTEKQILKYLKANSPCFHEVQDVPGLHAFLLSVIFIGQEKEFDFVEMMFVLLALHMQGFLYLNFLQDLQKPQVGKSLLWARHFIYFLQLHAFHMRPELHKANWQTFLEALWQLLGKRTLPYCTLLA